MLCGQILAQVAPEEGYAVVAERLRRLAANPKAGFQEAELALTLLYELGEGAPEEAFKPGRGTLGQLALGAAWAATCDIHDSLKLHAGGSRML
jgi:exportin-T